MLSKILLIVVFAAAIVFFCWMLINYWMRTKGRLSGKAPGKLRASSKTAFAMTNFWNTVEEARELPKETIKEELGSVSAIGTDNSLVSPVKSEGKKVHKPASERKKYRIRENM